MHLAYKHLDSRLRIAELTVGQWTGVVLGLVLALAWGFYLCPFGGYVAMGTAIYLGGIPIAAVFLASQTEFNLGLLLRSAVAWRRTDGRYAPGPGDEHPGYQITEPPATRSARGPLPTVDFDLEALWDS